MTTIACTLKVIAADSCYTFDDVGIGTGQVRSPKLYRIRKSIFGMRGANCVGQSLALDWIRRGAKWKQRPVMPKDAEWNFLELSPSGIYLWSQALDRDVVNEPNFAIGSGAKVALYCMRHLGMDPLKAVQEAAKVDVYTGAPFVAERIR